MKRRNKPIGFTRDLRRWIIRAAPDDRIIFFAGQTGSPMPEAVADVLSKARALGLVTTVQRRSDLCPEVFEHIAIRRPRFLPRGWGG